MLSVSDEIRRRMAEWTALPMYCLSLMFLIVLAILLVLWVDVPLFFHVPESEAVGEAGTQTSRHIVAWISPRVAVAAGYHCLMILGLIWPVFVIELACQFIMRNWTKPLAPQQYYSLCVCICPPLRMCARNDDMGGNIWFPSLGWQQVDDELRERLEKLFSIPMIFIALAILPVLLVEFGMKGLVETRPWLQCLLHASTGVIWFAFAAEFVVMVSVAEKKLKYCKDHWIDLAIILLPFISFLRSLRAVRAMRLARVAKLQQLSKMGRLYRMRGLAMRAVRALMILELLSRVFRIGPERKLKKLRTILEEKEREIESLRREIERMERLVEQRERAEFAKENVAVPPD